MRWSSYNLISKLIWDWRVQCIMLFCAFNIKMGSTRSSHIFFLLLRNVLVPTFRLPTNKNRFKIIQKYEWNIKCVAKQVTRYSIESLLVFVSSDYFRPLNIHMLFNVICVCRDGTEGTHRKEITYPHMQSQCVRVQLPMMDYCLLTDQIKPGWSTVNCMNCCLMYHAIMEILGPCNAFIIYFQITKKK